MKMNENFDIIAVNFFYVHRPYFMYVFLAEDKCYCIVVDRTAFTAFLAYREPPKS